MDWLGSQQEIYILPIIMAVFIGIVWVIFYLNYIKPAKNLNNKLLQLLDELKNIDSDVNKDLLDSKFEDNTPLKRAWLSYKKTFHDICKVVDGEAVPMPPRPVSITLIAVELPPLYLNRIAVSGPPFVC